MRIQILQSFWSQSRSGKNTVTPILKTGSYGNSIIEFILVKKSQMRIQETERKLKDHGLTVCCHYLLNNRNNNILLSIKSQDLN